MYSFIDFLLEYGEFDVIKRLASRTGKEGAIPSGWVNSKNPPTGGFIPLKKYSEEDEPIIRGAEDIMAKEKLNFLDHGKKEKMEISKLTPTQPYLHANKDSLIKKKLNDNKLPNVVTHQGKSFVMDGHHNLGVKVLRGKTHANVNHLNLDKL